MRALALLTILALACAPVDDPSDGQAPFTFAEPDARPDDRGPGGPARVFTDAEIGEHCGYMQSGPTSFEHHNMVAPYRGHLVFPWAAEWGIGGVTLYEADDPCNLVEVGMTEFNQMRESHAIGLKHLASGPHAGDWAVVTHLRGIMFWDLSDPTQPQPASELELPGVLYPDSYARVVLSVFWQYPYVYVAGADNGVYVVDATDPTLPTLVTQVSFPSGMRAGGVFALGDRLVVTSAEQTTAELLDISDPRNPAPFPGGRFDIADSEGRIVEAYHANMAGDYALFARKEGGGGPILYDISDPTAPVFLADRRIDGMSGGYVFYDEGLVFTGDSNGAHIVDMTDLDNPILTHRFDLEGDLDTMTPYGNVSILSVDDEAVDGQASAIVPHATQPDTTGPSILAVRPQDGAEGVASSTIIGIGFNEFVDPASVFAGSVRLYVESTGEPVDGEGSAQEATAAYSPRTPLLPGTTYRLEVLEGGIVDLNGNPLESTWTSTFTTAN